MLARRLFDANLSGEALAAPLIVFHFANLLPPISMFGGKREKAKSRVAERIIAFFERFYGI